MNKVEHVTYPTIALFVCEFVFLPCSPKNYIFLAMDQDDATKTISESTETPENNHDPLPSFTFKPSLNRHVAARADATSPRHEVHIHHHPGYHPYWDFLSIFSRWNCQLRSGLLLQRRLSWNQARRRKIALQMIKIVDLQFLSQKGMCWQRCQTRWYLQNQHQHHRSAHSPAKLSKTQSLPPWRSTGRRQCWKRFKNG